MGSAEQRFASADAVLVDFELDAKVTAETIDPRRFRQLIDTQLMFLVGQLNGDRSVGRHGRAQYSVTTFGADPTVPGAYAFTYHARIPVAWGGGPPPVDYVVTLPARVGEADQIAFAEKYASTCTDPEGGVAGGADAGRMFLFYRPQRAGCTLSPDDVVTATARVTASAENSVGKYPEYHLAWEDDVLDVVTVFGMELDDGGADDGGVRAYEAFLESSETYLRSLQSEPSRILVEHNDAAAERRTGRLVVDLPGGRKVRIEAVLVPPHLAEERTWFDDWYEARTPDADLLIYSGHAGLGANVRALMTKGAFRRGKYVVAAVNGCDTLAYLDRTLGDRFSALNPDDPDGTKYLDTVSNVLGGYFDTGDETSLHLVRAFVEALHGVPRTYAKVFEDVDPTQIIVVTGEEDNAFRPGMIKAPAAPEPAPAAPTSDRADPVEPAPKREYVAHDDRSTTACVAARGRPKDGALVLFTGVLVAVVHRSRRRLRVRP